ncbi:MAG: hypothetical protein IJ806_01685 [Ruminococcus sp.]|nr:hypothetical protein [Ruminococcus sp.]
MTETSARHELKVRGKVLRPDTMTISAGVRTAPIVTLEGKIFDRMSGVLNTVYTAAGRFPAEELSSMKELLSAWASAGPSAVSLDGEDLGDMMLLEGTAEEKEGSLAAVYRLRFSKEG